MVSNFCYGLLTIVSKISFFNGIGTLRVISQMIYEFWTIDTGGESGSEKESAQTNRYDLLLRIPFGFNVIFFHFALARPDPVA